MAFDERHAQIMRKALAGLQGVSEKRMFGGLCFLLNGNMLCGVHQAGGMARVGKEQEAAALGYEGVKPLSFTGRPMGGLVELNDAAMNDKRLRAAVLKLAINFVSALPAK
ncbi:MAG: TfoX/Sxy family protein [Planctomycetaceae bacterium]